MLVFRARAQPRAVLVIVIDERPSRTRLDVALGGYSQAAGPAFCLAQPAGLLDASPCFIEREYECRGAEDKYNSDNYSSQPELIAMIKYLLIRRKPFQDKIVAANNPQRRSADFWLERGDERPCHSPLQNPGSENMDALP